MRRSNLTTSTDSFDIPDLVTAGAYSLRRYARSEVKSGLDGQERQVTVELSPQAIKDVEFSTVRKGYDPEEVKSFLTRLAAGLDEMRSHLVASDARARAAMARVQELSARDSTGDADSISKALLLAQRTADATVAESQRQASTLLAAAEQEAQQRVAEAERRATEMVQQADVDARSRHEAELQNLTERRHALERDVDHLGDSISTSRERVAEAINLLQEALRSGLVVQPRSAGGPASMPAPISGAITSEVPLVHSAAAEPEASSEQIRLSPPDGETGPLTIVVDPWDMDQTRQ